VGPAHFVPLRGLAVSGADAFATPLGDVPVDDAARQRILPLPQVQLLDSAHAEEHSLEVQVPFLQRVLGEFSLVPLVAGEATDAEVAEVLEELWGGDETLIVISSDLSHYYDYETARQLDGATTRAIESLEPHGLGPGSACGRVPVRGLLLAARNHGLRARALDLRSSGDTAGPRDEVVGYGAYAFA
jgi:AmmeMemoRadiSam system protein B